MSASLIFTNKDNSDFNYDYAKRCYALLEKIDKSEKIVEENKTYIQSFIKSLQKEGLCLATIRKYLAQFVIIGELFDRDFNECEKQDIEKVVGEIKKHFNSERGDESIAMHITTLKKLIGWVKKDEDSVLIKWIKIYIFTQI